MTPPLHQRGSLLWSVRSCIPWMWLFLLVTVACPSTAAQAQPVREDGGSPPPREDGGSMPPAEDGEQRVALVVLGPDNDAPVAYLEELLERELPRVAPEHTEDLPAIVNQLRSSQYAFVLVLEVGTGSAHVIRTGDGAVTSRNLGREAAQESPYGFALAAAELLNAAGQLGAETPAGEPTGPEPEEPLNSGTGNRPVPQPSDAIEPAEPAGPPASDPVERANEHQREPENAAAPESERPDGEASRLSVAAGLGGAFLTQLGEALAVGQLSVRAELQFHRLGPFWFGFGARGWFLGQNVEDAQIGAGRPGTLSYRRHDVGVYALAGPRFGRFSVLANLELGLSIAPVDVRGDGQEVLASNTEISFWAGLGPTVRAQLIAGFSLGAAATVRFKPEPRRYLVRDQEILREQPFEVILEGELLWEWH